MLRRLFLWAAGVAVLGLAAFWFMTIPATVPTGALSPHTPDLANGKELFLTGGCSSCHAVPKQEDSTRLGGGLGLVSSFGTFYVPNISPDPKDGIGGWTEAQKVALAGAYCDALSSHAPASRPLALACILRKRARSGCVA